MPLIEAPKVKVQLKTDASVTREFTKQGWEMIQGPNLKWVLSADQSQPEAKKKAVAAVESVRDRKPELREEYKKITGKDADEVWNEARLFVEISKAQKVAANVEPKTEFVNSEVKVEPPIAPLSMPSPAAAPGKRGRKAKVPA